MIDKVTLNRIKKYNKIFDENEFSKNKYFIINSIDKSILGFKTLSEIKYYSTIIDNMLNPKK